MEMAALVRKYWASDVMHGYAAYHCPIAGRRLTYDLHGVMTPASSTPKERAPGEGPNTR
jgi:hypothetical protein